MSIVFVAGAARSGSTLLGEMLGAQPDVFHAGEISLFWRDAHRRNSCACGEPIPECAMWGAALDKLQARLGVGPPRYAELARTRAGLARTSRPTRLLHMIRDPRCWSGAERSLVEATDMLIETAIELSSCRALVDSSKTLPAQLFHRLTPQRSVKVVQLIRDPRAVVASITRSQGVRRGNAESLPPGASLPASVAQWLWANGTLPFGSRLSANAVRLRYEYLVADPDRVLSRLCESLGLHFDPHTIAGGRLHTTALGHAAVGNPRRREESAPLVVDERWRTELTTLRQGLVRATTWPLDTALGPRRGDLAQRKRDS